MQSVLKAVDGEHTENEFMEELSADKCIHEYKWPDNTSDFSILFPFMNTPISIVIVNK